MSAPVHLHVNWRTASLFILAPANIRWSGNVSKDVLVVETESGIRALLGTVLTNLGTNVRMAATGHLGVQEFVAHADKVGAIIASELSTPMDGSEFVDRIRAIDAIVPIFLFLGHSLPDWVNQPRVEVFLKPEGLMELCKLVSNTVSLASAALVREQSLQGNSPIDD
jgi:CheY-like chemotaxis protein